VTLPITSPTMWAARLAGNKTVAITILVGASQTVKPAKFFKGLVGAPGIEPGTRRLRASGSKGDNLVHDPKSSNRFATAPVSHQKQPDRNATNAIEIKQNRSKINGPDRYSAAHNGLVAGSSPAGPTNEIKGL
jgi:hypothetical protein